MIFAVRPAAFQIRRTFATTASRQAAKVAILGAAGGIGQPLSLLLKKEPLISHLSLYDIVNGPGVAADVSHINTASTVTGHGPEGDGLHQALDGAQVVVIPAGVPRKPGMTRDDLFNTNAGIVQDLAEACARACPKAHMLVISNPINSTVPIVSEVFKKAGVYDPRRIFGVTTLDCVRASRFFAEHQSGPLADPAQVTVPVVGGHAGVTIIPLFSQVPAAKIPEGEAYQALVKRVQFGGDEVVKAKNGMGSATLSMAYAGAHFACQLLRAIVAKETGIVEPAYVKSELYADQGVDYFASKVELGPDGIAKIYDLGNISPFEQELVRAALPELKASIEKGIKFAQK